MTRSGRRTPGRPAVLLVLLTLLATACVGPALRDDDYRRKAVASLEQLEATIAGTEVALDAAIAGRSFATSTAVTLRQHEETVSWTHTAFASRQPPPGTDAIRAAVVPLLAEASAVMGDIRIAANRTDVRRLAELRGRLGELGGRVEGSLREVRR
ncbi:MAG: hypothetical protein KY461_01215 [Actinobacteria bacterium]|nr:hypothetical protein [Actinomycetota bacterium]